MTPPATPAGDTTARLQTQLASGDVAGIGALFDAYGQRLLRSAWGMLGDRAEAEDVVQDVFVGLVRARTDWAGVEHLTGYLFTALRHAVGRRWAARSRAPVTLVAELPEHPAAATEGPDEDLQRALLRLPVEQREVIALKVDGELTFAEIGRVLGVSPNTAASRYRYALERLRLTLGGAR